MEKTAREPMHSPGLGWRCADCERGEPWPCEAAQRRILAEGGAPGFMALMAFHAIEELPHEDARGIWARFTDWTRP